MKFLFEKKHEISLCNLILLWGRTLAESELQLCFSQPSEED